jgi:hypothetical protein
MKAGLALLVILSTPISASAQLSWHARVAPIYLNEATTRGGWSAGALNWAGVQYRQGPLRLDVMGSAEPYTFDNCGYAQLLASDPHCGPRARDITSVHPLLMRASVALERTAGNLTFNGEAALAGEPALGPVVYLHRTSAAYDPVAPFTHHLTNAHHAAYSVLTLGIRTSRVGVAASAFDSHDRHANAKGFDPAMPDAFSGRLSFMLSDATRMTVSSASLPASGHAGHATTDARSSASFATFEHTTSGTALLGMVGYHAVGPGIRLAMIETTIARAPFAVFGRIEAADDLREILNVVIQPDGSHAHDITFLRSTGGKLVVGSVWTRGLLGIDASLGGRGSLTFIPAEQREIYENRTLVPGFSVFVILDARSRAAHRH